MVHDKLSSLLKGYDIIQPQVTFLRHNENRTYRVNDANGRSYLLRIHQPIMESMTGLQHSYDGLLGELQMLDLLAQGSDLIIQSPSRNQNGDWITVIEHEGKQLNCSVLTWLEGRDLSKEDLNSRAMALLLGSQLAELHLFFRQYQYDGMEKRPSQGIAYNKGMIETIKEGLTLGLFTVSDISIIENSIQLINSRLEEIGTASNYWGYIHGDLGLGNIILTPEGKLSFIDFGFFGTGYYLLDVAMGALMIPAEHRDAFLQGYYGHSNVSLDDMVLLEGFMLVSIIGFYAFQMGNESVHAWMRERMPELCAKHCLPFLSGERIFYTC